MGIAIAAPPKTTGFTLRALNTGGSPGCGSLTGVGLLVVNTLKVSPAAAPDQLTTTAKILALLFTSSDRKLVL